MRRGAVVGFALALVSPAAAAQDWSPLPREGAPSVGERYETVWTGREIAVVGSNGHAALYDPSRDAWRTVEPRAPSGLDGAGWCAGRLVVLGSPGALYDPGRRSWQKMAPRPSGRPVTGRLWAERGVLSVLADQWDFRAEIYEPESNHWTTVPPNPRVGVRAAVAWTGTEIFVWNGTRREGEIYDVAGERWFPMTSRGAPSTRGRPTLLWTGDRLIVWGRRATPEARSEGGVYDAARDRWSPIPRAPFTSDGAADRVLWTGSRLVVLRVIGQPRAFEREVAAWDPATRRWTRMPDPAGALEATIGEVPGWRARLARDLMVPDRCTVLPGDRVGCVSAAALLILDAVAGRWTSSSGPLGGDARWAGPHALSTWVAPLGCRNLVPGCGTDLFEGYHRAAP